MSAYAILQINITNPENYKEYLNQVTTIVKKHQGEYIVRGGKSEVVLGKWDYQRTVVVRFPSYDVAFKWYNSGSSGRRCSASSYPEMARSNRPALWCSIAVLIISSALPSSALRSEASVLGALSVFTSEWC